MPERTLVIETLAQLRALRTPSLRPRRAPTVELPTLPAAERREWESRLHTLLGACGCEVGAICLLLAVVGYAAWAILGGSLPVSSVMGTVLLGVVVAVLAATLGKGIGLAIARFRLARAVDRLAPRLQGHSREAVGRRGAFPT
jgi:hypothetical protein